MRLYLWGQAGPPGPRSQRCPPHQIAIHTLWNIRIVVLAKPEHENRISHICTDTVKTGIANTLGEQGGAASFPCAVPPGRPGLKTESHVLGPLRSWADQGGRSPS